MKFFVISIWFFAGCNQAVHSNFRTVATDAPSPLISASASQNNGQVSTGSSSPTTSPTVSSSPSPSYSAIISPSSSSSPSPSASVSANNSNGDYLSPTPGQHGELISSSITDSSVSLSWVTATDAKTASSRLEYLVYSSTSDNIDTVADMEANGTPSDSYISDTDGKIVTGLHSSTTYFLNLIVKDPAGNKAAYTSISIKTLDVIPPVPGSAGAITASNITSSSVTISWSPSTDDATSSSNLQYIVYRTTPNNYTTLTDIENFGTAVGSYSTNIVTKAVSGLVSSRQYYFSVVVKDESGNKALYPPVSVVTLDIVPPTVGGSGLITAASVTHNSLVLNWTKAVDNVTPQADLEYQVYQSLSNNVSLLSVVEQNGTAVGGYTTNINTKSVASLIPNSAYYFAVIVRDASGNKSLYNASFSTLPLPATMPTRDAYAKTNTAWTYLMHASNGTLPLVYALTTAPSGATINASTGLISYTPGASTGTETFTVQVTDASSRVVSQTFTLYINAFLNCVWTGVENYIFTNANNWIFCSQSTPWQSDYVVVESTAPNQPQLSVTQPISGFGPAAHENSGGTLTINPGVTLAIWGDFVRSDVTIIGSSSTCTTCIVSASPNSITDDATLTIGAGLTLAQNGFQLSIGSATESGHLILDTGISNSANWPTLSSGIYVRGYSGHSSSVVIDGLNITSSNRHGAIVLGPYAVVEKLRNINFLDPEINSHSWLPDGGLPGYINLSGCATLVVNDFNWTGLNFAQGIRSADLSYQNTTFVAAACSSGFGPISITGTGRAYGLENDPNNVVNWANSTSATCVWTGAVDTSWTNTRNWNNCSNGRGNFPDQLDWVVVPAAPANQPSVTGNQAMQGTSVASFAGGTITINANSSLYVATSAIDTLASSVKFGGGVSGCTTCALQFRADVLLGDSVTMTLLPDIQVSVAGRIYVGESSGRSGRAANFVALGGPVSTRYPTISPPNNQDSGIYVDGSTTANSTVTIDGLVVVQTGTYYHTGVPLWLADRYSLVKLDNFTTQLSDFVDSVRFSNCSSPSDFVTTWSNITFAGSGPYGSNVSIGHASCSAVSTINITGQGANYGSSHASDPNSRLNWQ